MPSQFTSLVPSHRPASTFPTCRSVATLQRKCACGGTPGPTGECEECRKKREGRVQREAVRPGAVSAIPAIVDQALKIPGHPLDGPIRAMMEPSFGHDFSRVRLHTGALAAQSAEAINATAYTTGTDVVLGAGAPDLGTPAGRHLLAHELTHVVQQSRGGPPPGIDGDPALETAAQQSADHVASGRTPCAVAGASGRGVARLAKSAEPVRYEVKLPDGVKYLTTEEIEILKQEAIRRIRMGLKRVAGLSDNGREAQVDMLKEYHGGVESFSDLIRKPKALIGIASDMKAGVTPPYIGMWSHANHASVLGMAALEKGDLATAARMLRLADTHYREAMAEWNTYREATIGGAEMVASNLETVRDVSFAIALAAGAAVAAPVIAASAATAVGTGGLGLTGFAATAATTSLTAAGTATTTGLLGAGLGGGSSAAASYANTGKVDYAAAGKDAAKFGKQGLVTGLTAGLGTAVGAGNLAQPLIQQAARRCLIEAGVGVTGEVTAELLNEIAPDEKATKHAQKQLLPGPARAALTGCISGALGAPIGKIGSGIVRTGVEKTVTAAVGYADARLGGQSNDEAIVAAVQGVAISTLVGRAQTGTHERAARAKVNKASGQTAAPGKPSPEGAVAGAKPASVEEPAVLLTKGKPTVEHPAEPNAKSNKGRTAAEEDPNVAVMKEEATARQPLDDGHEAVVTPHGVAGCSPSPCPVIHVEYAAELKTNPEYKQRNDAIQKMRKTNPKKAAAEAAQLINELKAMRQGKKDLGSMRDDEIDEHVDRMFDEGKVTRPDVTGGKSDPRIGGRRVPKRKRNALDIQDVPRKPGETSRQAVARIRGLIGKTVAEIPELNKAWQAARAEVLGKQKLTSDNYKELYDETRRRFYQEVRRDPAARKLLAETGFELPAGTSTAPMIKGTGKKVRATDARISLDHLREKAIGDNWQLALDADNLQLEFAMPNTMREIKQARHPDLRTEE